MYKEQAWINLLIAPVQARSFTCMLHRARKKTGAQNQNVLPIDL